MTYIRSDLLLIQRQGERERNREIQRYRGREKGREIERKKGTVKMKNEIERETHTKRDINKILRQMCQELTLPILYLVGVWRKV